MTGIASTLETLYVTVKPENVAERLLQRGQNLVLRSESVLNDWDLAWETPLGVGPCVSLSCADLWKMKEEESRCLVAMEKTEIENWVKPFL